MASIRSFNLQGMDLREPFGDGLMYLQDMVVDSYSVRSWSALPGLSLTTTSSASHSGMECINNRISTRHLNYSGTNDCWTVLTPGTGFSNYTSLYPLAGDGSTQVGVNTAYSTSGYSSHCRVGDQAVFADNTSQSLAVWAGSNKTSTLNSTASTRTASTTSGSNVVTFSGAVTGLDATWENTFIYLSGFPKRPFRVVKYLSTSTIVIDTVVDFTTAGQTWCMQPYAWVGCQDSVFTNSSGASLNEVAAVCVEGHQARLFAANYVNGGQSHPHRVSYSGTMSDANSSYLGIHNWYSNSYFDAAPEIGNSVVAMKSFGGDLLIFKDKGIVVLRGVVANNDPSKFGARVDVISDEIRCGGSWNVCRTKYGVYLFSPDGIFIVTGAGIERIDEKIWPWVRENASLWQYGDGTSTGKFTTFVMDGKVYTDLHTRHRPNDDAAYHYVNLYLVWDMDADVWMTRTFHDTTVPNESCRFVYSGKVYTAASPKSCSGTTSSYICYFGSEATGDITSASSVATVYSNQYRWPQIVLNGVHDDSGYPGYVRTTMMHVLHDTDSSPDIAVAVIPNYNASLVTDDDLGVKIDAGALVKGDDIGNIVYELPASTSPPAWSRFNVGSIPPSVSQNACVSYQSQQSANTRIYGISLEYEPSSVVAP